MLYYLYTLSSDYDTLSFLRLFRYVTFRAGGAALTAFLLTLVLGPVTTRILKHYQAIAPGHLENSNSKLGSEKQSVPTMGGALILCSVIFSILLWAIPNNSLVRVFIGLLISLGIIGFIDDYRKIIYKNKAGLSAWWKISLQFLVSLIAVICLFYIPETSSNLAKLVIPLYKHPIIDNMYLPVAFLFSCLVVVGSSNAVNLSDGMDGLAIGCTIICAVTYSIFAYVCGHRLFANYLQVPFIPGSSEVVLIATAMAGAGLGFLWHNCYPASMFMGDTGSLSMGGAVGLIAVVVKQELLLLIVGGVFVIEAGSVILQVLYFKITRRLTGTPKRLFRCAPIHHHFQQKGWKETQGCYPFLDYFNTSSDDRYRYIKSSLIDCFLWCMLEDIYMLISKNR